MHLTIRRATAEDWRPLRAIRLQSLGEAPYAFGSTLQRELDFSEDIWRQRAGDNLVFLACSGDEVEGTATGLRDAPGSGSVRLVAMYVSPEARGTGCAFLLLDAVTEAARTEGARHLVLDVTDVNPVATRCYSRYGFRPTGATRPLAHTPQITEIEMMLTLG
jgi:GNAT superfamily N-acetyltransferase